VNPSETSVNAPHDVIRHVRHMLYISPGWTKAGPGLDGMD
jgi:hypothetical protein